MAFYGRKYGRKKILKTGSNGALRAYEHIAIGARRKMEIFDFMVHRARRNVAFQRTFAPNRRHHSINAHQTIARA